MKALGYFAVVTGKGEETLVESEKQFQSSRQCGWFNRIDSEVRRRLLSSFETLPVGAQCLLEIPLSLCWSLVVGMASSKRRKRRRVTWVSLSAIAFGKWSKKVSNNNQIHSKPRGSIWKLNGRTVFPNYVNKIEFVRLFAQPMIKHSSPVV